MSVTVREEAYHHTGEDAARDLGVYFTEPETTGDVERLRIIRNSVRRFMTENTREISPERQTAWWNVARMSPQTLRVWLVRSVDGDEVVGYVMLSFWYYVDRDKPSHRLSGLHPDANRRYDESRANVTVALVDGYRRRGIGTELYRFAREQSPCPVRAIIRTDNVASRRAAEKAGFTPFTFARGDGVVSPDVVYLEKA